MKIQTKRKSHKKIIVISAIVLIFAAAVCAYFFFSQSHKDTNYSDKTKSNDVNYNAASNEQVSNGTTIKSNSTNTASGTSNVSGSDQPPAPTSVSGSSKKTVVITITSPTTQASSSLQIRSYLNTTTDNGNCVLSFSRTGYTTITQTVPIQASANITACQTFDLSTLSVTKGTWAATITFSNDSYTGSVQQNVVVQ